MRAELWTKFLLGVWALAFFGSFAAFYLTPAEGLGWERGLHKLSVFLGWQAAATTMAILVLVPARSLPRGTRLRRWGHGPLLMLVALTLGFVLLFVWVRFEQPAPVVPPVSAPIMAPAQG